MQLQLKYHTELDAGQDGNEFIFIPTKKAQELHAEILSLYNKIKTVSTQVEINNEIYYTTKIEGSHTSYQRTVEIHDGKPIQRNNYNSEMMVKGGFEATRYLNLCGYTMTDDVLINTWSRLVEGCCQNIDIRGSRYRIGPIYVGNHEGLPWQRLEDIMSNWIEYYNSERLDDFPFIKAALLHVSFEMIHPFCDGNGRAGRLLMINYLISRGYDKCHAISFSREIANQLQGYYYNLDLSDNVYSDCTPFIEYMLYIFRDTFLAIVEHRRDDVRKVQLDKRTLQNYIVVDNQHYPINSTTTQADENGSLYTIINKRRYNVIFTED